MGLKYLLRIAALGFALAVTYGCDSQESADSKIPPADHNLERDYIGAWSQPSGECYGGDIWWFDSCTYKHDAEECDQTELEHCLAGEEDCVQACIDSWQYQDSCAEGLCTEGIFKSCDDSTRRILELDCRQGDSSYNVILWSP